MEKLIACLQSPYIPVHVYMQENEVHVEDLQVHAKNLNFIFTLVKLAIA